jgi:SAM-dependent methyltransferase
VFLAEQLHPTAEMPLHYHGIDNSAALLAFAQNALAKMPHLSTTLTAQDIIEQPELPAETYDLVTLFGVIHHVPGADNRLKLMQRLAACVAPGGLLVFAAWRFYEHDRFRERIIPWSDDIEVEPGDYLLDWRRGETALRYCHYVDDTEQARLIRTSGLGEILTYKSDIYNCYSIMRKL